jgi:hypothetical protein
MVSRQTLQIKAFSVFICYEHTDEHLCQEFKKHLAPLQLSGAIAELRDHSMIQPGQDIECHLCVPRSRRRGFFAGQ